MGNQATQNIRQRQTMSLKQKIFIGGGISVGLVLFFFFLIKVYDIRDASAASSGEESPASASTSGGSGKSWNNASNVYSSNGSDAYSYLSSSGGNRNSEYLQVTNFGFAIPSGATIDGVVATVECAASSSYSVYDKDVYLTKTGTGNTGSDQASSTYLNNYDTDFTYGSSSSLWGASLTPADVNSSNFGIRFRVRNGSGSNRYAYVDHVVITVYYSVTPTEGPGGVISSMSVWLDANDGVTGTTQVSNWEDKSLQGNDAAMSTSTYRPSLESASVNYNNAIDFDGGDEYLESTEGAYSDDIFVVLIPDDQISYSLTGQMPVSLDANNASIPYAIVGLGDYTSGLSNEVIHYGVGQTYGWKEGHSSTSTTYTAGEPMIINISNDDGSSSSALYVNQNEIGNANYGSYTTAEDNVQYRLGGNMHYVGGYYYDGKIAEFISYSSDLSTTNRKKVASYLAIKYGITLEDDYVLSDGTTVWDDATNASYHNNVAGIARDDDSDLDQQKSISQHANASVEIDKGGAFGSDLDAVIWGHNNGALSVGAGNGTAAYANASNRTWKVELNGTPGNVSVSFDLSMLNMTGGVASDYALLIDSDGTFTSGAAEHIAGATLNGTVLTFTGVSFTDGYYFTIGEASGLTGNPGGVSSTMELWLTADFEVTESSGDVTAWDDQSGNSNDASSAGSTGTAPALDDDAINYNPAIKFEDDGNKHLATSSLPVSDDMSWFVVYSSRQTSSSTSFWSNPALIGGESSGNSYDYTISQQGGKPFFKGTSGDNFGAQASGTYNDGRTSLLSTSRNKSPSGTNYLYMNGSQEGSYASDNNTLSDPSTIGIGNHDDPATGSQFKGNIAEVIAYSSVLSQSDRHKVETYLGMKYGVTLDHDYVNSSGTTIWDQSSNSTFHNRVTGIMRDDDGNLDQRQSKSVHSGGVVAIGNADIASTNAGNSNPFSADDSYVIFGDDDDDIFGTFETDYGTTTNAEVIDRRVARTWYLEEGGTVGTVEVTFTLTEFPGVKANASTYDFTELRLLVDADGVFATNSYSVAPTSYVYNSSDTSITFHYDFSSGATYFSLATLDEAGSPLPVEFSYFNAEPTSDGTVELAWGTATETNNDYFDIERSQDGLNWEVIGTVGGAGTSIVGQDYLEYDYQPHYGVSFYRIKQVDFDGTHDYSIQRQIEFGTGDVGALEVKSVYPNPFTTQISFDISSPSTGEAQVQLLNSNGSVVKESFVQVNTGLNALNMNDLGSLATGYYVLRVVIGDQQISERVLKR